MTRALLSAFLLLGCTQGAFGGELLFSFSPVPNNSAMSTRPFSTEELLVVTVTGMQPGDRLMLSRCGNPPRCSVGSPVAEWTSETFEHLGPMEIYTEGKPYAFLAFGGGKGMVGVGASLENGVTILRFLSGMSVRVEARASR